MNPATMRSKNQVYSVGNYLMTGKVLGKGHFARVEEATHRIIGKKVAIKIIDLTCIKEDYARRNLHREPRVMAKLRHPCIAALYETMMHGPRLYVVMEAAGGGDLCAHVLAARNARGARGLPESRARALAAQLVSAVRHMHARGVVHRDLKMENIMLDTSKQFIKIVDFGLSNVWSAGGALRTPCGSLEYAAPELFVDGRKYGSEVDLWSIGVIVYGMVTGGLPFTGAEGGAGGAGSRSRPLLRAAIARGFGPKQRAALAGVTPECKTFIQHLLEPKVDLRMKIEEASRHRWVKRPGLRMKTHPLGTIETKTNRDMYRQISELCGQTIMDVVAQVKADPFGCIAGIYNIKTHLHQMQTVPGADLLWSSAQEIRPPTPPEYRAKYDPEPDNATTSKVFTTPLPKNPFLTKPSPPIVETTKASQTNGSIPRAIQKTEHLQKKPAQSPRFLRPLSGDYTLKSLYANGDGLKRLPIIDEHSSSDKRRVACLRKAVDERRLSSCPIRSGDVKRTEFYKRGGDGLPSWRATGILNLPPRLVLQSNATTIKRASLGNIVSPHSSSNGYCKSERAISVGCWYPKNHIAKEPPQPQRLRRTAAFK